MNNFDKYLEDVFMKNDGMMFLDDDLPDAFDAWVSNLDNAELIEYANKAMTSQRKKDIANLKELYKEKGFIDKDQKHGFDLGINAAMTQLEQSEDK